MGVLLFLCQNCTINITLFLYSTTNGPVKLYKLTKQIFADRANHKIFWTLLSQDTVNKVKNGQKIPFFFSSFNPVQSIPNLAMDDSSFSTVLNVVFCNKLDFIFGLLL